MTVADAVKCRCGMQMEATQGGGQVCPNCDSVQRQEPFAMDRRKTVYDIRFDAYWAVEMDKYEDNSKPEATPPDTTEGETP